jgi:hypothetical protein
MEARYGGTDVMERSCAVARGKDTKMLLTTCPLDSAQIPPPNPKSHQNPLPPPILQLRLRVRIPQKRASEVRE